MLFSENNKVTPTELNSIKKFHPWANRENQKNIKTILVCYRVLTGGCTAREYKLHKMTETCEINKWKKKLTKKCLGVELGVEQQQQKIEQGACVQWHSVVPVIVMLNKELNS